MIIYEDGSYQMDTEFPDTLYDEDAKYVIPDNSELAQKYIDYVIQDYSPVLVYDKEGNIIDVTYDTYQKEKQEAMKEIAELEKELADGDYKIIKCYECSILGEELPYDITTLKAERDAIRKQINELQDKYKD